MTSANAAVLNGDNICVNAIVVNVDENGAIQDGWVPPDGHTVLVNNTPIIGAHWNGTEWDQIPENGVASAVAPENKGKKP
jgi:hypothetical protein